MKYNFFSGSNRWTDSRVHDQRSDKSWSSWPWEECRSRSSGRSALLCHLCSSSAARPKASRPGLIDALLTHKTHDTDLPIHLQPKRDHGFVISVSALLANPDHHCLRRTHRHWRGPRKGSILGTRASSCRVWTSQLTSQWRLALSLCWTPWCTWWQSCLRPGPGSRTASRHGTPDPVGETEQDAG